MPIYHKIRKKNQAKELKKLNDGLLYTDQLLDPSKPEIVELFENVQIALADALNKKWMESHEQ